MTGEFKARSAAWVDINNDGDLDLVTGDKFFINNLNKENHWLKVKLRSYKKVSMAPP